MERTTEQEAPGLRWQRDKPMWRATKSAVAAGYPVKSANLSLLANDPAALASRCQRLQAEMRAWLSGRTGRLSLFDGTIRSLIDLYQSHPESPYRLLKPSSRKPYDVYLRMMRLEVGPVVVDDCDGPAVRRWFRAWSDQGQQIPKARMAIAILKAVVRFGVECRSSGCPEFFAVLKALVFPAMRARTMSATADQVIAARAAAHKLGHPLAALAYAMQFEGAVRQWDVTGQWIPLEERAPSAVLDKGLKWIGPTWAHIDENLIFRFTPSKTALTSGKEVALDLSACQMVLEEFSLIPLEKRRGPLIVNPVTGLPYREWYFGDVWRGVRLEAGLPEALWNRDLRAAAVTEARAAGATTDDVRKVAGHAEGSDTTAEVYDRATLEAHRRVAAARAAHRLK